MGTATALPLSPETALSACPQPELRRLEVTETETAVVLTGRVSSFYLKQLAQEAVKAAAAPRQVVNRVVVRR